MYSAENSNANYHTQVFFTCGLPMTHCKAAFTLAEILIVIGMIGIIANLTLPGLISSTSNQTNSLKVKKAYSMFAQAFNQAEGDGDAATTWGWTAYGDGTGSTNVFNVLAPYLNLSKNCNRSTGCFPNVTYQYLNTGNAETPNSSNLMAKAILSDGTAIAIATRSADCSQDRGTSLALQNYCGDIYIDINGEKAPNQWGKDFFTFYITKYGVIPVGTSTETEWPMSKCNKAEKGISCSGWIIEKGNMDYLN